MRFVIAPLFVSEHSTTFETRYIFCDNDNIVDLSNIDNRTHHHHLIDTALSRPLYRAILRISALNPPKVSEEW